MPVSLTVVQAACMAGVSEVFSDANLGQTDRLASLGNEIPERLHRRAESVVNGSRIERQLRDELPIEVLVEREGLFALGFDVLVERLSDDLDRTGFLWGEVWILE